MGQSSTCTIGEEYESSIWTETQMEDKTPIIVKEHPELPRIKKVY